MLHVIAAVVVLACWPLYILLFFVRPDGPVQKATRDRASIFGILLQFTGVGIVWVVRRPLFSAFTDHTWLDSILAGFAAVAAVTSVVLSWKALKVLGQNWNFVAGVGRDHHLVTRGPYSVIRHPLYAAFFLLTLATGLVWSAAWVLAVAIPVFGIGVWIRIRVEERILRATFGTRFDDYVQRVPALFPW